MINLFRRARLEQHGWRYAAIAAVLLSAFFLGRRPSPLWIGLIIGIGAVVVLLKKPVLGLFLLIVVALIGPISISTGTEVRLNLASLLLPVLFVIWLLTRMGKHDIHLVASPTTKPLVALLILVIISIFVGNAIWDPNVPRRDNFIFVQIGQWGLFALSAVAFWLVGNLITQEVWLRRLTATFLLVGGVLAIIRVLPGVSVIIDVAATAAITRAPFWVMLATLAAGQLLFNRELSTRWRIFLVATLGAILLFAFVEERATASHWVGVGVVIGVLVWLRFPKLQWLAVAVICILLVSGVLFRELYDFAGGNDEWVGSGLSRGVLIGRVLEDSMRNPITGIGPAAYRWYGMTRPLGFGEAWWTEPLINTHNNYVDLFSQTGIVGLGLFFWFMLELLRVGLRLRSRYKDGFAGGYVASMIGSWFSIIVIMALADWFLPFIYNIGFSGFQAAALVWMFFGGLLFYEGLDPRPEVKMQS